MKLEVKINRLENAVIKLGNKEVVLDGEFLSVDTFESGKYMSNIERLKKYIL